MTRALLTDASARVRLCERLDGFRRVVAAPWFGSWAEATAEQRDAQTLCTTLCCSTLTGPALPTPLLSAAVLGRDALLMRSIAGLILALPTDSLRPFDTFMQPSPIGMIEQCSIAERLLLTHAELMRGRRPDPATDEVLREEVGQIAALLGTVARALVPEASGLGVTFAHWALLCVDWLRDTLAGGFGDVANHRQPASLGLLAWSVFALPAAHDDDKLSHSASQLVCCAASDAFLAGQALSACAEDDGGDDLLRRVMGAVKVTLERAVAEPGQRSIRRHVALPSDLALTLQGRLLAAHLAIVSGLVGDGFGAEAAQDIDLLPVLCRFCATAWAIFNAQPYDVRRHAHPLSIIVTNFAAAWHCLGDMAHGDDEDQLRRVLVGTSAVPTLAWMLSTFAFADWASAHDDSDPTRMFALLTTPVDELATRHPDIMRPLLAPLLPGVVAALHEQRQTRAVVAVSAYCTDLASRLVIPVASTRRCSWPACGAGDRQLSRCGACRAAGLTQYCSTEHQKRTRLAGRLG